MSLTEKEKESVLLMLDLDTDTEVEVIDSLALEGRTFHKVEIDDNEYVVRTDGYDTDIAGNDNDRHMSSVKDCWEWVEAEFSLENPQA